MQKIPFHTIQGITVHSIGIENVLESILLSLKNQGYSTANPRAKTSTHKELTRHAYTILPIFTVNPEFVIRAHEDARFKKSLNSGFLSLPDGSGILVAGLLKGTLFKERITGLKLVRACANLAVEHDLTIGLLGGRDESAQKTCEVLRKDYPSLSCWARKGPQLQVTAVESDSDNPRYFTKKSRAAIADFLSQKLPSDHHASLPASQDESAATIVDLIGRTHILFVGFGAPKQEYFIEYLKKHIAPHSHSIIAVGVGGSFDEIAGIVPECPVWIERIGFKWLFRLSTEPHRWRRQLALLRFAWRVLSKR